MKALKTFRDSNKKFVSVGDKVNESDYSDQTLKSYKERGFIGPSQTKPSAPKQTKGAK